MIAMRSRGKRAAAQLADVALGVAAPLLVRGPRAARPLPPAPRVLVVRCDHIGDAAMATVVLEPLRRALAPSRLDVLCAPWAESLYRNHPLVDDVLVYAPPWWHAARRAPARERRAAWRALPGIVREVRARDYDVGLDLRGDLRQIFCFLALGGCRERVGTDRTGGRRLLTRAWRYEDARHEIEKDLAIAALIGAHVPASPRLRPPPLPPLAADVVADIARLRAPGGVVALAPRGSRAAKSWPVEVAREFVEQAVRALGVGVVVLGGPGDREMGEAICRGAPGAALNLAGRCALDESAAVLRRVHAAVCVDSGPMHLAALVGTPVVALFGPTSPERYGPWTDRRIVLRATDCACSWAECARAAEGGPSCLASLGPARVVQALRELLAAGVPAHAAVAAAAPPAAATALAARAGARHQAERCD